MEQTVLPNWLEKRANLSPNRNALITKDVTFTFKELFEHSKEYSSKLYNHGIRFNSKVGVIQSNSVEMVLTIHALLHIGAEIVLHNTRLTEEELSYQFKDAQLDWLIIEDSYYHLVKNHFVNKESIITVEMLPHMKSDEQFEVVKEFNLLNTATVMYTSGTSGNPKGVMQTYGNHWWSAVGSMLNLGLNEKDTWLCTVPLFHISGLSILFRSVIYGITVVLHEQFQEDEVNFAIKNQHITIMSVVTAMLNRMLYTLGEETYPSSFRCMLLGGGPAPLSLLESCKQKGIPVYQTYGMTETSSQIVTLSPEYSLEKLGSAGKALFPSQLKIQKDGKEVTANEVGEILVKGPNVTKGYIRKKEATIESFENGWLKTGDMGYIDEDGFLYVVDRRSDLIISGGENVYPAEIEAALVKHPDVFEAGVTGISDERWGQIPVAFVVLHTNADRKDELIEHCKTHLARYKVPKQIYIVDHLPRNSANKLLRRKLVQLIPVEEE